jgi:hypothetical protein
VVPATHTSQLTVTAAQVEAGDYLNGWRVDAVVVGKKPGTVVARLDGGLHLLLPAGHQVPVVRAPAVPPVAGVADFQAKIYPAVDKTSFTPAEVAAVKTYTGKAFYSKTNPSLRTGDPPLSPYQKGMVKKLDAAFSKHTAQQPMITYRGLSSGGSVLPRDVQPGHAFRDDAFVATSASYARADNFAYWNHWKTSLPEDPVIMEITIPAGVPALPVVAVATQFPQEHEVVLPRGTTFTVTGTEFRNGRRYVKVEAAPPPFPPDVP